MTINSGATVNASQYNWSLGVTGVTSIAINQGTLYFRDASNAGNNGGTGASSITMTGGTIASAFNFDLYSASRRYNYDRHGRQ